MTDKVCHWQERGQIRPHILPEMCKKHLSGSKFDNVHCYTHTHRDIHFDRVIPSCMDLF